MFVFRPACMEDVKRRAFFKGNFSSVHLFSGRMRVRLGAVAQCGNFTHESHLPHLETHWATWKLFAFLTSIFNSKNIVIWYSFFPPKSLFNPCLWPGISFAFLSSSSHFPLFFWRPLIKGGGGEEGLVSFSIWHSMKDGHPLLTPEVVGKGSRAATSPPPLPISTNIWSDISPMVKEELQEGQGRGERGKNPLSLSSSSSSAAQGAAQGSPQEMLLEMAISLRHFLFTLLLLLFLSSLERQLHYCTLQKEEVFGQKKENPLSSSRWMMTALKYSQTPIQ